MRPFPRFELRGFTVAPESHPWTAARREWVSILVGDEPSAVGNFVVEIVLGSDSFQARLAWRRCGRLRSSFALRSFMRRPGSPRKHSASSMQLRMPWSRCSLQSLPYMVRRPPCNSGAPSGRAASPNQECAGRPTPTDKPRPGRSSARPGGDARPSYAPMHGQ
jgi:hypothetical protein